MAGEISQLAGKPSIFFGWQLAASEMLNAWPSLRDPADLRRDENGESRGLNAVARPGSYRNHPIKNTGVSTLGFFVGNL
jgi:hypothetical protein